MLTIILNLLIFVSVILILVSIHEFGHFIVAKAFGIKVLRFSIGFGKPLFGIHDKQGTEYVIAPIPLGGYVKLLDERETPVTSAEKPFEFNSRPLHQRFLVLLAGPGFNFIFAILAFWIVFAHGFTYVKPIIGSVLPNSPAAQAGFNSGDEIISINGKSTPHWSAIAMQLAMRYGGSGELVMQVQHQTLGKIVNHNLTVDLRNWRLNALRPNPLQALGITPYAPTERNAAGTIVWPKDKLNYLHYSWLGAAGHALQTTYDLTAFNLVILYKMLTGVISYHGLGGPLSIIEAAAVAANQGILVYLNFLALLSISIAIINLLPIPGLDGGQIFYLFIELVRGKPLSVPAQILAFRLGIIALILLMITAITNDLLRLG